MAESTNPFGDLNSMLEQFKVPGVDMSALVEMRKKNIEAIVEANKSAYDSMQQLERKQSDMLTQAMQDIQAAAKASPGNPGKQSEVAHAACLKALDDIKDIAEIARESQGDAMASITQRANEHVEEIKKMQSK